MANIFFAIETYLAQPNRKTLQQLKQTSHSLTAVATQNARNTYGHRVGHPNAEELGDAFIELVKQQAEERALMSPRFIANDDDPKSHMDEDLIFTISENHIKEMNRIIRQLISDRKQSYKPEILLFAIGLYAERREESNFDYCDNLVDVILNHSMLLELKALELKDRKCYELAEQLDNCVREIKEDLNQYLIDDNQVRLKTTITERITNLKINPLVQTHRGLKQKLTNFIMALSIVGLIYLASTSNQRGSFWYRVHTNTENQLEKFENSIPPAAVPEEDENSINSIEM